MNIEELRDEVSCYFGPSALATEEKGNTGWALIRNENGSHLLDVRVVRLDEEGRVVHYGSGSDEEDALQKLQELLEGEGEFNLL